MKLNQNQNSMQPRTSDPELYVLYLKSGLWAKKPNPPTPEAVAKAQFVDKTYQWKVAKAGNE